MRPNNSFKPKPLRYGKGMAGKACHAFASTTPFGLTQALDHLVKSIDIQAELTACLRRLGAVVSDDEPGSNKPRNADYWFPQDNVVAELKCLSQDYFDDQNYIDWLNNAYLDWVKRGLARPLPATTRVNLTDLPRECTDDVTSFIRKRLESSLKDANDQIKVTRSLKETQDARGLLFLVNDGNYGLHPGLVQNALARSLHKFSGINTVVHFTANMPSALRSVDQDVLFWCAWSAKRYKPPVDRGLLERIKLAWFSHLERTSGEPIPELRAPSSALYDLNFIKR